MLLLLNLIWYLSFSLLYSFHTSICTLLLQVVFQLSSFGKSLGVTLVFERCWVKKALVDIDFLDTFLIPSIKRRLADAELVFQDENASLHRAKRVQTFFQERHISSMTWPATNESSNLWCELKKMDHEQAPSFRNVFDLNVCFLTDEEKVFKAFKAIRKDRGESKPSIYCDVSV